MEILEQKQSIDRAPYIRPSSNDVKLYFTPYAIGLVETSNVATLEFNLKIFYTV